MHCRGMSAFRKLSPEAAPGCSEGTVPTPSLPSGCKFNATGLPVTASGIPSLDCLLADGIPIGSVVGMCEDCPTNYWQIIGKLFISQGLHSGQTVALPLVEGPETKATFLSQLPTVATAEPEAKDSESPNLSIAWRYQHLPSLCTENEKNSFSFDLTKTIDQSLIQEQENAFPLAFTNPQHLLMLIRGLIEANYNPKVPPINGQQRRILRIFLPSLGSLGWNCAQQPDTIAEIASFLCSLKAILRYSYAVCVVSFPSWVFEKRIFPFLDCIFSLDAAVGKSLEWQGYLKFHKLMRIASFASNSPIGTLDYVFKCKKKRFTLEKFYLPPELSDTPSRTACSTNF